MENLWIRRKVNVDKNFHPHIHRVIVDEMGFLVLNILIQFSYPGFPRDMDNYFLDNLFTAVDIFLFLPFCLGKCGVLSKNLIELLG